MLEIAPGFQNLQRWSISDGPRLMHFLAAAAMTTRVERGYADEGFDGNGVHKVWEYATTHDLPSAAFPVLNRPRSFVVDAETWRYAFSWARDDLRISSSKPTAKSPTRSPSRRCSPFLDGSLEQLSAATRNTFARWGQRSNGPVPRGVGRRGRWRSVAFPPVLPIFLSQITWI